MRRYIWDRNYVHEEGDETGVGSEGAGGTRYYEYVDKEGRAIGLWGDPRKDPSKEADNGWSEATADLNARGLVKYTTGKGEAPATYVDYEKQKQAVLDAGYKRVFDPEPSHKGGANFVKPHSPTLHITLYPKRPSSIQRLIPHQECPVCPVTYTTGENRATNQRSTWHVDRWTQGGTWTHLYRHLKEYFRKK